MSTKITVSFLYQYYEEEDKIAFQFLIDDILERVNYNEVKYFIHKYDVISGIITNIRFTKNGAGQPIFLQEKIKVSENYHYNLILAKKQWVYFLNNNAAAEKAKVNLLFTYWHSFGPAFKNRKNMISQSALHFNIQLNMLTDNIAEYFKAEEKIKKSHDMDLGCIPSFVLADSINEAFNSKKIDILFLCNCYSQTLENGFIFKDSVQYLASSESTISNIGPNLRSLFALMEKMAAINIDVNELAKDLVISYKDKFFETRIINYFKNKSPSELLEKIKYNLSLQSVCINNLDLYTGVLNFLNAFAKQIKNDKNLLSAIQGIRDDDINLPCRDVSLINKYRTGVIDGYNLFELLAGLPAFTMLSTPQIKIITSPVIHSHFPIDFFQNQLDKEFEIKPHGISIFFPSNKKFNTANHRKYSTEQFFYKLTFEKKIPVFSKTIMTSEWLQLLKNYYEL